MAVLTRAERKKATREHLISVAHEVFAEKGILDARTAHIAKKAGVAHGTIFVHFTTREDLVTAVVEESARETAGKIHMMARGELSLREVLEAHVSGLKSQEAFYARLVMEGPRLAPFTRSRLIVIQSAIAVYFGRAAKREMAAGVLRKLPVGRLFNTWLGLLHHYICNRDLFAPGGSVLETRGGQLIDHFVELASV